MARRFLRPFLLATIVFLAFGRLWNAEFTALDDYATVAHNPKFNPPTLDSFRALWTEPAGGLYIPITYSAWWLLAVIGAAVSAPGSVTDPAIFHIANVVIHVASTLVVFSILRRYVARTDWIAFAAAALFGVHPFQAETVGWVSGFKDLLCGLLALVAVRSYLEAAQFNRGAEADLSNAHVAWRSVHYWLGAAALVLAMLSKPSAMITPAVALALDVWLNRRTFRQSISDLWPWFVLIMPCMFWTKHFQDRLYLPGVPVWGRPLIATDALAYYLLKLVAPFNLTIDPGRRPDWTWASGAPLYTWILPVAIAVTVFRYRRRAPWLVAAALAMAVSLAPVLGLVPFSYQFFSTVSGHYMYLAMLGPAIAVAGALAHSRSSLLRSCCIIGLALCLLRSAVEAGYWKDNFTLFNRIIEVNPRSFLAHHLIGRAHAQRNDLELAAYHYDRAIRINPDYSQGHRDMGDLMLRLGNDARDRGLIEQGVDHLRTAMDLRAMQEPGLRPEDSLARLTVGRIYRSLGRHADARREFERILAEQTNDNAMKAARRELESLNALAPPSSQP